MRLSDLFDEAIKSADQLVKLHDALSTKNQRAIRSDWSERFCAAKLTKWPQKAGLWRSQGGNLIVVGTEAAGLSHADFTSDALSVFLRAALVLAMAAVDKVLHEAVSKRFVDLVKEGKLDDVLKIELSAAYRIAMESRVRKGKGGKIRSRPGPRFKSAVLDKLYRESFLSADKVEKIAALCGRTSLFAKYGASLTPIVPGESMKKQWKHLYSRRNSIAHECDIVRQRKAKRVRYLAAPTIELRAEIARASAFGAYLAKELDL